MFDLLIKFWCSHFGYKIKKPSYSIENDGFMYSLFGRRAACAPIPYFKYEEYEIDWLL